MGEGGCLCNWNGATGGLCRVVLVMQQASN